MFGKRRSSSRPNGSSSRKSGTQENSLPSVAALKILAATAIPPRPSTPKSIANEPRQRPRLPQRKNSDWSPTSLESPSSLLQFALNDALDEKSSLSITRSNSQTFLSVLLSPPDLSDDYSPDDFLTRSILSISPQYNTDEKRPAYNDVPTAALRRYLNPSPKQFTRELGQFNDRNESIIASIQLETYKHTVISPPPEVPITRNREVRENSDFLRVIVLEMNMRRQGKLSDTSQGKARFVLPPRQTTKLRTLTAREHWNPINFD
ncbi:hypothetical protein ABW20_dc0105076 [Dactylellina cionopaga]|nr:hypothetical protein ABW20_dc0105076 [Dactylellina cionopaga]